MRLWKLVSVLSTLSIGFFVIGQSCLTLRDTGTIYLPDIIVFPPFVIGIIALVFASAISLFIGKRHKPLMTLCYLLLCFLTFLSLAQGHYHSTYAIREAVFSPYGIGVWMAFLFALPASNKDFWIYFKQHLLFIFKLLLVVEVFAIILLLSGSDGLLRINFSTSISLFILMWGILSSDKTYFFWGLFGTVLFLVHSFVHDQRETFLLPFQFMLFFIPLFFVRSFSGQNKNKSNKFNKFLKLFGFLYLMILTVVAIYFILSKDHQKAIEISNLTKETRSFVVEDYMDSEMMEPRYLLLGKGVNGYYKSKCRSNNIGGIGTSTGIEIGYLQMIVNVGLVYVLVMILMSLFPAIKAILKSNSPIVAVSGLWVVVRLINMTIVAKPSTDFGWFLFWICVGVVTSADFKNEIELNENSNIM